MKLPELSIAQQRLGSGGVVTTGVSLFALGAHGGALGLLVAGVLGVGAAVVGPEVAAYVTDVVTMPPMSIVEDVVYAQEVSKPPVERTFMQKLLNREPIVEEFGVDVEELESVSNSKGFVVSHQSDPLADRGADSYTPRGSNLSSRGELMVDSFPPTTLTQLMQRGFKPHPHQLLLALDANGKPIYADARTIAHLGIPGETNKGKTNIECMLMSQLVMMPHTHVYFVTPAWSSQVRNPDGSITDFRALKARLRQVVYEPTAITEFLSRVVDEMNKRIEERRVKAETGDPPVFDHMWVFLDEWPAILEMCGGERVVNFASRILRLGRQVNIHLSIASQDFQVQTIGIKTGTQGCFTAVVAPGLDNTTAKTLFGDTPINYQHINRGSKIKGHVIVKAEGKVVLGRIPLADNPAMYAFCGVNPNSVSNPPAVERNPQGIDYSPPRTEMEPLYANTAQISIPREEDYYAVNQPPVETNTPLERKRIVREVGDVEEWWNIHSNFEEGAVTTSAECYKHYYEWCQGHEMSSIDRNVFLTQLAELANEAGYIACERGGKKARRGLALLSLYEEVEEEAYA